MQNGVSLSTKESDLEVKYGMINFREEREGARTSLKYILSDMNDIRTRYIRLGFHLDEFRRNSYYYDFGYPTMEEFCAANLGMDKSALSRCINVYREFNASKSTKYEADIKITGSSMELDDRYKDYSYSQLCEMVSMDDVQRKQVTPDMTIKQIREIKKNTSSLSDSLDELDKIMNVSQDVSPVATSQQEAFDSTNYSIKKGIVQQNYVKNCRSLYNLKFRIFDKDGKLFKESIYFDVLKSDSGLIILRLMDDNTDIFP